MELCGPPRALPTLPNRKPFSATLCSFLPSTKPLSWRRRRGAHWLTATASEGRSTVVSNRFEGSPDDPGWKRTEEVPHEAEEAPANGAMDLLSKINLKLDPEGTYTILIYGAGAVVAVWLSSAIVGAIDSIPLFSKMMEVVGLAFTVWFSYRYLIFKENRDELSSKIEDLKKEIIGSDD